MASYTGLSCTCCAALGSRNRSYPMEIHCRNKNRPRTSPFPGSLKAVKERDLLSATPSSCAKRWTSQRLSESRTTSRGSTEMEKFLVISPGYSIKRSKDCIEVRLEEQGFDSVKPSEGAKLPHTPRHVKQESLQKQKMNEKSLIREYIVEDLHEQIAKLTALLKQEASEHQETQRRMTNELEEKVKELQIKKEEELRILQEKHAAELLVLQHEESAKLVQENKEAEKKYEELQKKLDFLKGSFKTYQEGLLEEMNEVWLQKEARWKESFEEQKLMEMSKQRHSLLDMFEVEKKDIQRRALKEQDVIQQSHKAQAEEAWKKYKEATQETKMVNMLKMHLQAEIADKNEAILTLNTEVQQANLEIRKLKNQIDKIEKSFDQSVSKVESKYKNRIQSLMIENVDLRRKLIAKSEQLFSERNKDSPGTTEEAHGVY
ncbi:flagellum-associated coiled-coil domain-containing protein 1 [Mixophyes fleayi]|uniref:flagellum-associated coiled-coil domain-containing protein 1 n=1 Tax=Mixophyes fleayi TaxID=3061075 RepID=UPI003F4DADF2